MVSKVKMQSDSIIGRSSAVVLKQGSEGGSVKHGRQSVKRSSRSLVYMKSAVALTLRDEVPLAGTNADPSVVVGRSRPQ